MSVAQLLELGVREHRAGRLEEAQKLYRRILSDEPNHADALHLLGVIASQRGQAEAAVELISHAISVNPSAALYQSNLGQALAALGRNEEAEKAYRKAIDLDGRFADAHYSLGNLLRMTGRAKEAIGEYRAAISLREDYFDAWNNLGATLQQTSQLQDAAAAYRRALELRPQDASAHFNLGLTLLGIGNLTEGWPEYEWRRRAVAAEAGCQDFPRPQWDGSDLRGQRILLHHEQGLGDTIQFARYAPLVAQRGGQVILQCQPELLRLLKCLPDIAEFVRTGDALPKFDVHCPLLSLPAVFQTKLDSIPAKIPYLHAERNDVQQWAERLKSCNGRKIGLCWAGKPTKPNDHERSLSLSAFSLLAGMPNSTFITLQKETTARDTGVSPLLNVARTGETPVSQAASSSFPLIDGSDQLRDFADTAALIDNLDLVISVDTAVAHLAGAMGKPVWVLLPCVPDWRWMQNRTDSPWYPSMRLFRQPKPGDWATPMAQIRESLQAMAIG